MRPRPIRRSRSAVLVALLLGFAFVVITPPAMACACGGVVAADGTSTTVDREVALITGDGTTETVHLQLSMDSTTDDLGLLVPTPTPATVKLGEAAVFSDLNYVSRARPVEEFHLFGPPVLFDGGETSGGPSSAGGSGGVQALSTVNLGPLEATTLRADDPAALQAWLTSHDYHLKETMATQVQPYIDEGWAFVAVRLTQDGKALHGLVPPIVMTFASSELVYPMRMSRAATKAETVRTYVLADHRVQRTDPTSQARSPQVMFAGPVDLAEVASPQLHQMLGAAGYLTVVDQYLSDPGTQLVSDFTFANAPSDEAYQRTYTVDTYGIPIDIAVIILIVLIALVLVGWRLLRRRRSARLS